MAEKLDPRQLKLQRAPSCPDARGVGHPRVCLRRTLSLLTRRRHARQREHVTDELPHLSAYNLANSVRTLRVSGCNLHRSRQRAVAGHL